MSDDQQMERNTLGDLQAEVTYEKKDGKRSPVYAIIPKEQAWMYYSLEKLNQKLDSINGKLTFFVVITILGMLAGLVSMCSSLLHAVP